MKRAMRLSKRADERNVGNRLTFVMHLVERDCELIC